MVTKDKQRIALYSHFITSSPADLVRCYDCPIISYIFYLHNRNFRFQIVFINLRHFYLALLAKVHEATYLKQ